MKEIAVRKRFQVFRDGSFIKSFHFKMSAVRYARRWQSVGVAEYTVKDSKH